MRYIALFLLLYFPVIAHADTIHVPGDFPTIQDGIDAAVNGDIVLVAPGTYVENIDFLGKAITVKSSGGAEVTVVDGNGSSRVVSFLLEETGLSVLDGFTITNGQGGIYCFFSYPLLKDCNIYSNSATNYGGGFHLHCSSPMIENCTIDNNNAENKGGGLFIDYYSFPKVLNSNIENNTSDEGGGIYCKNSFPLIENCLVKNNIGAKEGGGFLNDYSWPTINECTFEANKTSWRGGAVFNRNNSKPVFVNCQFNKNEMQWHTYDDGGGGMCNKESTPTLYACTFSENEAVYCGGGMANYYCSSIKLIDCSFNNNSSTIIGGSLYNHNTTLNIVDCLFDSNSSPLGGGIHNDFSDLTINSSRILNNTATKGAGIYNEGSTVFISNCEISYNECNERGGALYNEGSQMDLYMCILAHNYAEDEGGGIYNDNSSSTIYSSIINANKSDLMGGGIYNKASSPYILNCTIVKNIAKVIGGGLCNLNSSETIINNCILRENVAGSPLISSEIFDFFPSAFTTAYYSNIKGGWPGIGNINAAPLFVDPTNNDFHLTYNSPCKDTGDNSAVTKLYDYEGDPRIAYGTVDMGADEFHPHLYYTGNATPGDNIELKFIGIPDDTVRLWIGPGVLDPPIHHPVFGNWYLEAPILLGMILGNVPADGVYVLPVSIPPDYTPWDIPIQAGIGMGLSNLCVVGVE